jgi:hypothetical protein
VLKQVFGALVESMILFSSCNVASSKQQNWDTGSLSGVEKVGIHSQKEPSSPSGLVTWVQIQLAAGTADISGDKKLLSCKMQEF